MSAPWRRGVVKGAGVVLILASVLPFHRLLVGSDGLAADQFLQAAPWYATANVIALLGVLAGGLLLWPLGRPGVAWLSRMASTVSVRGLAFGAGITGFAVASALSHFVFAGGPYLVDGMSQLLQAKLFAGGAIELRPDVDIAFAYFQYLAPTGQGWVSQYPPGFPALVAVGVLTGLPVLVGPVVHGVTAWLGVRFTAHVVPDDKAALWIAAGFFALSPFSMVLAASYMSHGVAALLGLLALWLVLKAPEAQSDVNFGLAAGLCVGVLATVRPLTALCVAVVAGIAWAVSTSARGTLPARIRFPVAAVVGGLPPVAALLWFNRAHFGSPLAFGYTAAQGPNHGLGFHVDPWGAVYGLREAVGYSATELRALGSEVVMGLPVPALLLVGALLIFAPGVPRRLWVVLLWAASLVLAGATYWHHDLSMGPRLLADTAPAWYVLVAWALAATWRWASTASSQAVQGYARGLALALVIGAAGAIPLKWGEYAGGVASRGLHVFESPPISSLVFVHDTWESRLAGRLASVGLRDDQIRMVMASWSTCQLDGLIGEIEDGTRGVDALAAPSGQPGLVPRTMPSGSTIRTFQSEQLTPACQREAASDFQGVSGLPQRLWRGTLPGFAGRRPVYLRDMGPERNLNALAAYPDREPLVLVSEGPASSVRLLSYDDGMARLWTRPPGEP